MSKKKLIVTYEFGTFWIEGEAQNEGDTQLEKSTFNNLWNFILSSNATDDSDVIMSVHTRRGKKYIKIGRYIGTIQTKDGQIIEILPKIYKAGDKQEEDEETCRKVFLRMLKHFTDIKVRSFQNASLKTSKNFPIFEVYISNYINAVEQLFLSGIKKNYSLVEENQVFLKGKLDIYKQITKNVANKARFAIRYNKYIEDIPHNRVIVTTLRKLMVDSHSIINKAHIAALLTLLADIPSSTNVENDLRIASSSNRLFATYDMLIKWSGQFLLNKGFTAFSGAYLNQSLLFKAEKIFEDFIAYLFKKYAKDYNVYSQNAKYFLVDKHNGNGRFKLKPDIVVETDKNNPKYRCVIIDTKWKAIDENRPDRNYLIDMKDMYQMYAYGQKYRQNQTEELGLEIIPNLVLIYPYTQSFTEKLPEFIYEEIKDSIGLRLMVVPFDLTEKKNTYKEQVLNIIRSVNVRHDIQPTYKMDN